jgi:hypothetical protein
MEHSLMQDDHLGGSGQQAASSENYTEDVRISLSFRSFPVVFPLFSLRVPCLFSLFSLFDWWCVYA